MNTYDTGLLQKRLLKAGYDSSGIPKIQIINTCAVTQEATKEAIKAIRRLKAKDPLSIVVVTGCAAQVDTDQFQSLAGADLVVANSHKGHIEDIIKKYLTGEIKQKTFHSNIFKKEDLEPGGGLEQEHTRIFLKIQDGCNSFCTYCIIPFARGKSRSLPIRDLVGRINEFHWNGANEVVLTGVHIGDYEDETLEEKNKLEDLIETILSKTKIQRLRLTSLEPLEVSDRMLSLFADPRMCSHFHMSIQSASTKILKNMRRHYTADDVEKSLIKISERVKNVFVGMDVIVGFPDESDQDFKESATRLEALPWTRLHVFPYSERPGTKALKIEPLVPLKTRNERSQILRELSSKRYTSAALRQVNQIKPVLILENGKGLSRDYWNVEIEHLKRDFIGKEIPVKIIGYDNSLKSRMNGILRATSHHVDATS